MKFASLFRTALASIARSVLPRVLLSFVLLTAPAFAGDTFSGWISASGVGQIQYRWKTERSGATDFCKVEFRNMDDSDRAYYWQKVYFVGDVAGRDTDIDGTERPLHFYVAGGIESADEFNCKRVTDVRIRKQN